MRAFSAGLKSNYERIVTWKGTYRFEEEEWFRGDRARRLGEGLGISDLPATEPVIRRNVAGRGEFAVNVERDLLFVSFQTAKPELRGTDKEVLPYHQRSIITPEHYLHFQPNARWGRSKMVVSENAIGRAAFRDPVAKSEGQQWGYIPDPRQFFAYGRPFWREIEIIAEALLAEGSLEIDGHALRLSYRPARREYFLTVPGKAGAGSYKFLEYTFDEDAGFNVVSLVMRDSDGRVYQDFKWQHQLLDGTYVPSRARYVMPGKDGQHIQFSRTWELEESRLNVTLDPDTFTYRNLGLEEGDRFLDNIEGVEYIYRGGELERAVLKVPEEIVEALEVAVEKDMSQEESIARQNATDWRLDTTSRGNPVGETGRPKTRCPIYVVALALATLVGFLAGTMRKNSTRSRR